ncbi:MAG: hypothetical protein HYX54_00780 [Chloroflexi bacterium]|nr:hypothetical protein [Chloroflexota bacterium]
MDMLNRWAGYLAIAGGALTAIVIGVVVYDPNTGAWTAFFLVVALLGAAVFGFERRTRTATGQLGRAAAWLSTIGAVAILAVFAYAAATNKVNFDATATSDPLTPFWIVTAIAWFLGNIGFAVAIIRAGALSVIGGWLVLAGAVAGLVASALPPDNLPSAVMALFGLFGIGWVVVGYAGIRSSTRQLAT